MKKLLIAMVGVYQEFISPWLPNACRFYPTCSQYMIDAIIKHGIIKGVSLGVWRVLRCNPLCKGGYDPIK